MLSLLLAFTLQWTAPSKCADGSNLNCPVSWSVYRLQPQSPTWVLHLAGGKYAIPDSVTTWWPGVVRDDAPRLVASGAWDLAHVGAQMSCVLPDSLAPGEFLVLHRNAAGQSAWSNLVRKP